MAKYRKRPVVIEATRWFKNGDHPFDGVWGGNPEEWATQKRPLKEGAVVCYFLCQLDMDKEGCPECERFLGDHGWIDTPEGGHRVCPGDWIITGVENERYPCKPNIFEKTYEPAGP